MYFPSGCKVLAIALVSVTIATVVWSQSHESQIYPSAYSKFHRRQSGKTYRSPSSSRGDNVASATGHHGHYGGHGHHHSGRVQIKVYRGQSKAIGHGKGWHQKYFAPHGYWVRQPADNHGWGWKG